VRTLRRITILSFLLLYVLSSLVTTQYRSERVAQRVIHTFAPNDVQARAWTSSDDNYPRFREAKKAAVDFAFRPTVALNLVPQSGRREFTVFHIYWEIHHSLQVAAVRAPPEGA
jgi:hypothetical protein